MEIAYVKLRDRLDELGIGYPKTKSGIEMDLIRQLFTIEEAELFVKLEFREEKKEDIAVRTGISPEVLYQMLETMTEKGLIFRRKSDGEIFYSSIPFVVGIMEYQLDRLDREFSSNMQHFYVEGLGVAMQENATPLVRTIPINKDLASKHPITPYENVEEIFLSQDRIAVANCICRSMGRILGTDKGEPLESCFSFNSVADYYVEKGMARYIDAKEAMEIVDRNQKISGLVMQPTNGKEISAMCMCCGDHCGVLLSLQFMKRPVDAVNSSYFMTVDKERCVGCGNCVNRCQMKAIRLENKKSTIDLDRCLGCGTCTVTCTGGALRLEKKPQNELYDPPENFIEANYEIMDQRKKKRQ